MSDTLAHDPVTAATEAVIETLVAAKVVVIEATVPLPARLVAMIKTMEAKVPRDSKPPDVNVVVVNVVCLLCDRLDAARGKSVAVEAAFRPVQNQTVEHAGFTAGTARRLAWKMGLALWRGIRLAAYGYESNDAWRFDEHRAGSFRLHRDYLLQNADAVKAELAGWPAKVNWR